MRNRDTTSTCPACGSGRHARSFLGQARFEDFAFEYRRCRGCASIFVDPMPDAALLSRIYSPDYVNQHYRAELDGEASSRELAAELAETARRIAQQRPGGAVLDIGCGAGRFLIAAREQGLRVSGHEREPGTAELIARTTGVPVRSGALAEIGERFDVVHLADVVEHSPRPIELLIEASDLLAPGGLLVARGPLESQRNLFHQTLVLSRTIRGWLGRLRPLEATPTHVSLFTLEGWHALLARAGLTVVEERMFESHWPAPETPELSARSLLKEVSLRLSASPLGARLSLGSRVITACQRFSNNQ